MKLNQHYDKLLHISCTFVAMCFLRVWLPWNVAIAMALFMQGGKVYWNYKADVLYRPAGDVLANVAGFGLYWLYVVVS